MTFAGSFLLIMSFASLFLDVSMSRYMEYTNFLTRGSDGSNFGFSVPTSPLPTGQALLVAGADEVGLETPGDKPLDLAATECVKGEEDVVNPKPGILLV